MTLIAIFWITLACFLIPLLSLLTALVVWRRRIKRSDGRAPVSEPFLRSPGESLRIKIDELGENVGLIIFTVVGTPATAMAVILLSSPKGIITTERAWVALGVCLALLLPGAWFVFQRATQLYQYHLGFHGERATGEELNQLMRDGCFVFHDVPITPYGNIDHVIVSPAGVFAVETKARRKREAVKGRKYWEVDYDGKTLDFPGYEGKDTTFLDQARMQADCLRKELSKSVGEAVVVTPIVALPGWKVNYCARNIDLEVKNPKNIRYVVLPDANAVLSHELAKRIVHQLNLKCRDVKM